MSSTMNIVKSGASEFQQMKRLATEAGFNLVDGSFEEGAVVSESNDVVWYQSDGKYYGWGGTIPVGGYIVPAGSTPATTGGIGAGAWVDRTDATLRAELASEVGIKAIRAGSSAHIARWGAIGDYTSDDTSAIDAMIAEHLATGFPKVVRFDGFKCRYVGSLDWPSTLKAVGDFAMYFAPFPVAGDGKDYLRPSKKGDIPGACIILSGGATKTATTTRTDWYSSFTYGLRVYKNSDIELSGIGSGALFDNISIVQDMDVYDSNGNLTTLGNENAAPFDVGFLNDDVPRCRFNRFVVFGYFAKAGTVILSRTGNDDPDYCKFYDGSTTGKHGLALITESGSAQAYGLSGTQTFGFEMYTIDHHSRSPDNAATYYADADTWTPLYIDGDLTASSVDINGHFFHGGTLRTWANHIWKFDHLSNVHFIGTIFESPKYEVTNSTDTRFLCTSNTKEVTLSNCRYPAGEVAKDILLNQYFVDAMAGCLTTIGSPFRGIAVHSSDGAGGYGSAVITADASVGDPIVQLTQNPSSASSGWNIRNDISSNEGLQFRYGGVSRFALSTTGEITSVSTSKISLPSSGMLTISSGVIAVTGSNHAIATESGAASDDLDTINGGTDGMLVYLRAASAINTVVIKNGTGNIQCGADIQLDNSYDQVALKYDSAAAKWFLFGYGNNGA